MVGCERSRIARRRTDPGWCKSASLRVPSEQWIQREPFFALGVTTAAVDSKRCSRRRSAGGDGGTTLFRSAIFDEDGGNPADIAASEATNQTPRDARAALKVANPRMAPNEARAQAEF